MRRARPDDPEPGEGRHLRGDGEGRGVDGGGLRDETSAVKIDSDEDRKNVISNYNYFLWQGPGGLKTAPTLPNNLEPISKVKRRVYQIDNGLGESSNLFLPPKTLTSLTGIETAPRYFSIIYYFVQIDQVKNKRQFYRKAFKKSNF